MSSQINQKTVAKNTLILYLRMGMVMLVSLYASRVVLLTLGVEDFGVYNVVATVVVMFSFMSLTLNVAIRRYIAYELGKNNNKVKKIFNASIIAVLIASIIIAICLETLGVWLLNYKLNIPPARIGAANFVFQFSILAFFLNMNLIPYSSAIVSYEKMGVYAYFGIAEAMGKLGIVLVLPILPGDKLKWYGLLIALLSILMMISNVIYCNLRVINIKSLFDFSWYDVRSIFSFSAWTVLGSMIYMATNQGVNMIYNVFFGVAINAAVGIAHQVAGAVNQFLGSYEAAFSPQLTKNYSSEGLSETTFNFVCQTSRLTILLILLIGVPIIANISGVLDLWLTTVPNYASVFTIIFIIYVAVDGSANPLYLLVYAKGDLKDYQMLLSSLQLLYLIFVYFGCNIGLEPIPILSFYILLALAIYVARLIILKKIMDFPIYKFLKTVVFPLLLPIFLFSCLVLLNHHIKTPNTLTFLVIRILALMSVVFVICVFLYLNDSERHFLYSIIKNKIKICKI